MRDWTPGDVSSVFLPIKDIFSQGQDSHLETGQAKVHLNFLRLSVWGSGRRLTLGFQTQRRRDARSFSSVRKQAVAALAWPCWCLPALRVSSSLHQVGLHQSLFLPSLWAWTSRSLTAPGILPLSLTKWVSLSPEVPEGLPTHAALSLPLSRSLCLSTSV